MALPKLELNRNQLTAGATLLVGLLLAAGVAWAFGQQFVRLGRMSVEEQRLQLLVDAEWKRRTALEQQLEYVQSDEYLERWARVEAKMVHPGEVLIVPVISNWSQTWVAPEPVEVVQEEPRPWWVKFLERFLGPANRW